MVGDSSFAGYCRQSLDAQHEGWIESQEDFEECGTRNVVIGRLRQVRDAMFLTCALQPAHVCFTIQDEAHDKVQQKSQALKNLGHRYWGYLLAGKSDAHHLLPDLLTVP